MSPTLDLGHLNDFNDDVVEEVNVKEALKSSIFVVQKAAAPKSGVEFRQGSIGTIRSSLATSCDVADFRPIRGLEIISDRYIDRYIARYIDRYIHRYRDRESTYCQALLCEQRLQKKYKILDISPN